MVFQSNESSTGISVGEGRARLLLLAVWFALMAGLAEVSILTVRKLFWQDAIQHLSRSVVWMAPLANVCFFLAVGCLVLLLMRFWPRLPATRVASFVFVFLASISALLLFMPPLHKYAALLFAAGLAVQVSRMIGAHLQGFHRLVRRTIGWALGLVAVLAIGVHGAQLVGERRALAQLPPASAHAPNVLLIVLDTVRAKSLSLYGYRRPTTPALESFAKTGVLFNQAYATSPWTFPSHTSMFTGRLPFEVSADWLVSLDATYPTIAEVLSARGYLTAGFVANTSYCSYETGLQRGFVHYEDYRVSPGEIVLSSSLGRLLSRHAGMRRLLGYNDLLSRKSGARINQDVLRWLSRQEGRPFFVFLNYYDAHLPYLPPPPFDEKFGAKLRGQQVVISPSGRGADLTPSLAERTLSRQDTEALDAYEGAIADLDMQIGVLLAELQQRRLLENTLVIITSDHGEQFGEHGLLDHGNSLYTPLLHVPLLMVFPKRLPADLKVQAPVTLRDIPATILSLLQLDGGDRFPGDSLERYWDNNVRAVQGKMATPVLSEVRKGIRTPPEEPISKGDMTSVIVERYHYIKNGDGQEELYDLARDPSEQHDLSRVAAETPRLEYFRQSLKTAPMRR